MFVGVLVFLVVFSSFPFIVIVFGTIIVSILMIVFGFSMAFAVAIVLGVPLVMHSGA